MTFQHDRWMPAAEIETLLPRGLDFRGHARGRSEGRAAGKEVHRGLGDGGAGSLVLTPDADFLNLAARGPGPLPVLRDTDQPDQEDTVLVGYEGATGEPGGGAPRGQLLRH